MDIKTFFKKVADTLERGVNSGVNTIKRELNNSSTSSPQQQSAPAQPQQPPQQQYQPQPQPQQQAQQPNQNCQPPRRWDDEMGWRAYFRQILTVEFGRFSLRENVPVQELVGNVSDEFKLYPYRPYQAYKAEWGWPYTFVLYEGGMIKGIILLAKQNKQYNHVKFLISKMYAKKLGIPFISFYMDSPNEYDYVVGRIEDFIN